MITSAQALKRYGDPVANERKHMVLWVVPEHLRLGAIPTRIYLNKDLREPLNEALHHVVNCGLAHEIKTWDGCFNIRRKKGGISLSLHSWALAIDINAAWNGFNRPPTMSRALVECFTDAGFDWGGEWKRPDGMHFQLARLP